VAAPEVILDRQLGITADKELDTTREVAEIETLDAEVRNAKVFELAVAGNVPLLRALLCKNRQVFNSFSTTVCV